MHASMLEMMHDHVRAIHRAVTGSDPPDVPAADGGEQLDPSVVIGRFGELESAARVLPAIAARVPPFSFSPPVDVIGTERELIVEIGVPGIDESDVEVQLDGDQLIVWGARPTAAALDGRIYFHAEMPRGPFRRVVPVPHPSTGPLRIEIDRGVVRVRLQKAQKTQVPQA